MTALTQAARQEAWRTVNEVLGDTTGALATLQRLAALGVIEEDRNSAALFHDAIYRILEGLIPRLEDAHAAALRIGALT